MLIWKFELIENNMNELNIVNNFDFASYATQVQEFITAFYF